MFKYKKRHPGQVCGKRAMRSYDGKVLCHIHNPKVMAKLEKLAFNKTLKSIAHQEACLQARKEKYGLISSAQKGKLMNNKTLSS
jgi:hypothetical protein